MQRRWASDFVSPEVLVRPLRELYIFMFNTIISFSQCTPKTYSFEQNHCEARVACKFGFAIFMPFSFVCVVAFGVVSNVLCNTRDKSIVAKSNGRQSISVLFIHYLTNLLFVGTSDFVFKITYNDFWTI